MNNCNEAIDNSNISKESQKKCKVFINDLLNNSGIVPDKNEKFVFTKQSDYFITKDLEFKKEVNFIIERKFPLKNEIVINEIMTKLNTCEWKNHDLIQNFKPEIGIQTKQRYEPITEIEKLNGDKSSKTYTIDEGKIGLIYIWSIYWPVCKKQLKLIDDFCFSSMESEDKFISINIDSNSRQSANKLLNSLNLNKNTMEHFFVDLAKFPTHQLNYIIKECSPATMIINNEGCIDFLGSVFEIDLKEKIKSLQNRHPRVEVVNNNITKELDKKNLKVFIKNLETRTKMIKDKKILLAPHLFNVFLRVKKTYLVPTLTVQSYQVELTYHFNQNDEYEIDKILFKGIHVLKNQNLIQVYANPVNTVEVILWATNCTNCGDDLHKKNHYYCQICELYWCLRCGNALSNMERPELLHKHFLFYLRPSNNYFSKYVLEYNQELDNDKDFKYFSDNIVSKEFVKLNRSHYHTKCDGCLIFPIKTVRWRCLNCIFKNLCNDCMTTCENHLTFSDEITQRLRLVGCDPLEHVFQKIVFDGFMM